MAQDLNTNALKILWHSNAPWSPTGYGNQTNVFLWRLKNMGHDLMCSCFYGLNGSSVERNGIMMLPGGYDAYGNDTIVADAVEYKRDIVISLIDVWVLNPQLMQRVRWYPWTPVDHDPIPPVVAEHLQVARRPIAMAQFGVRKMKEVGLNPLYVPHGVNTQELYPMPRDEARRKLNFPNDKFMVGIVAANKGAPSRKAFAEQFQAFGKFYQKHPDAVLYLHTDVTGKIGEPLIPLLELAGIPKSAVAKPSQYKLDRGLLDAEYMRCAFSAMDVLMNCSKGEGFGVPIIEAQACGTPVIVTNFSAMPELVRAGWTVGISEKFYSQESWQVIPSVDDMVSALELAYENRGNQALREQAHKGIVADYDADVVAEKYWKPVLAEIAAEIEADKQTSKTRAKRTATRLQLRGVYVHPDCVEKNHDWAEYGVFDGHGYLLTPCKRNGCAATLARSQHETIIKPDGFEIALDGQPLDVEDDPEGGVAKIVWREIRHNYDLDSIDFQAGDTVLDLGAQVGLVSLYLGKKHPEINIIAYEPVPENYQRLVKNLERNGVQNVTAINKAVTGDGRNIALTVNLKSNSGGASAFTTPKDDTTITVESVTLTDILARHDKIKLLKIDTEGAEYEILGALNGDLSKIEYIRGEFHVNNVLRQFGYDPQVLIDRLNAALPGKVKVSVCPMAE